MSRKDQTVHTFEEIGTVTLYGSIPDLIAWGSINNVELTLLNVERVPSLGFRVGRAQRLDDDIAVLDVCQFEIPDQETRVMISRFELTKQKAKALAAMLLDAVGE